MLSMLWLVVKIDFVYLVDLSYVFDLLIAVVVFVGFGFGWYSLGLRFW